MPDRDDLQHDEEEFSSDPAENLRLQNELLKLKMQAELGAEFGGDMSDLPPEIEQQILQQVIRFHEAQSSGEVSTVGQQLGQEEWPRASSFSSPAALEEAWNALQDRLTQARLHVGFLADYPLALKWDFITQELMKKETFPIKALEDLAFGPWQSGKSAEEGEGDENNEPSPDATWEEGDEEEDDTGPLGRGDFSPEEQEAWAASGMPMGLQGVGFMGFIYEEYHPNHAYAIEEKVQQTLRGFFENSFGEHSSELSNPLVTDAGQPMTHEAFREKVARFHDLFAGGIKEWEFIPGETVWDTPLDEDSKATAGTGYVEGSVRYIVTTDDGAESEIIGPFKASLEYHDEWWNVSFFYLHGFSWA